MVLCDWCKKDFDDEQGIIATGQHRTGVNSGIHLVMFWHLDCFKARLKLKKKGQ